MKLTEEGQNKVLSKIGKHFLGRSCPVCRQNAWEVDSVIYEVREFAGGNLFFPAGEGERLIPVIVVHCRNCGNLLFFNAVRLGIVEQQSTREGVLDGK